MAILLLLFDFNSIVVRLKGSTIVRTTSQNIFQFHCGAIKSAVAVTTSCAEPSFQFHCGAIKSFTEDPHQYFMSKFQFHCGAIKSQNGLKKLD